MPVCRVLVQAQVRDQDVVFAQFVAERPKPTLGDAVPVLTILVVSGVLAPVRWGSGWRLLVLPFASAALAYVIAFSIQIAISIQIALSIQQAMASLAMLIGASRIVLGMQESPQ